MREIKFRAWDKEDKKMLMDIHLQYDGHPHEIHSRSFGECFDKGRFEDDLEIMQYTGLKDKNGKGKEVYFDDIAKNEAGHAFVVEWDFPLLARLQEIWFEVIGNIYENPELLEEEKCGGEK